MILESINLTNFRNYSRADFSFSPQTTLIFGPNAVGKTNLLEAVYYLATGKSFRASYDRETVRAGEEVAYLEGILGDAGSLVVNIAATALNGNGSQKRFKINGVGKRLSDFAGNLRAVYFGPEEIQLVTGPPSRRRKYLDSVLVQIDREYARALSEYEKVVRQRNRLLLLVREGEQGRDQLGFWDEKLVTLGASLTAGRGELFGYFNPSATLRAGNLFLEYQPKVVSNEILEKGREREIGAGMTLWGPHRDDFRFARLAPSRDLAVYGSRGEQRLAVLHLKLAELEFITERTGPPRLDPLRSETSERGEVEAGDRPILLLDDIFSELDESNRGQVLKLLGRQQTIVTATELDQIDGEKLGQHDVIRLGN